MLEMLHRTLLEAKHAISVEVKGCNTQRYNWKLRQRGRPDENGNGARDVTARNATP